MIRSFALCASALAVLAACGTVGAAAPPPKPPAAGVMLLSLSSGSVVRQISLGNDPLAVALAPDGRMAFVADNDLGDVFALKLPSLNQVWRTHVGGAPSGLLLSHDSLFVSEYDAAAVAELDAASGRPLERRGVAPHPGELADWNGEVVTSNNHGFGVAAADGSLWTYTGLQLPAGLKPFWLQAGRSGELLVSAEGSPEDGAPGGVFAVDTHTRKATELATPRDPDQVLRLGDDVFVAAHGDRNVLVLRGGRQLAWAPGAEAVALAPDSALGLLVVVTDAVE